MKALVEVTPTPEQLPIISNPQAGVTVIRGAAGSGKTTTALLMLRQLSQFWVRYRERHEDDRPVRILVLTFNSTLRGYIDHLAKKSINTHLNLEFQVMTFAKWAQQVSGFSNMIENTERKHKITSLGKNIRLEHSFLLNEVDYIMGRFVPSEFETYLNIKRDGRGISPRIDRGIREQIIKEVIIPYNNYKIQQSQKDWNDLALAMLSMTTHNLYDVIICDETQDLSANEIRAIMHFCADPSTIVFVIDSAQRIYPRGWTWTEAGIRINSNRSFLLKKNHRNTVEICALAKNLLEGIELGDDGRLPDLESCNKHGIIPYILKGRYNSQCNFAINYIKDNIDLSKDSVAFAHPKAGGYFNHLKKRLSLNDFKYVELTRKSDWPIGDENIALITMHSAKGLEFDYVFILGLNNEMTPHGEEDGDSDLENLRRLLAVTITRARKGVILGYKPDDPSSLINYLHSSTYNEIKV